MDSDVAALVSVCSGLSAETSAQFQQVEQFSAAKAAATTLAAEALARAGLHAPALALLALGQAAPPQEPDYCRAAAAAAAGAGHATLRACGKYGAWGLPGRPTGCSPPLACCAAAAHPPLSPLSPAPLQPTAWRSAW
jgi:hypothetical protein